MLEAVRQGKVSEKRYQSFLKLRQESAYHARSYLEKRRRDKEFGKMCKRVMKQKKKK